MHHTHTKLNIAGLGQGRKPRYPSMQLYEEILLLRTFVNEKPIWVVENTHPYYQPVVSPTQRIGRHLIWSNIHFNVGRIVRTPHLIVKSQRQLQSWLGISVNKIKGMDGIRWRQVIRNCFHPKIAESMLEDVKSHLGVSRKQIVNSRFFNPKE